ncbi:MAG: hypothetical protein E5W15_06950 [Mesorhizobium sp.]|uniref:hypothetical protein n=1 Tax=unclassified Mesorhizobium TaxID=325217 RepID=UPI000FC9CBFA|nr:MULTISPECIES: hypothetical protein [unclassified Mesorhizobium]RUW43005.1 hypothetical protein EOA37_02305 [Mesorhizobium sp. M2A.F.Ca.ET.015.02.1.1]RVC93048.1 hypothetical protein EN739_22875 [Mesorhizobium sp. M2A.F.Ca.ET.017.03.2.1]RVD04443.1 hypothetical protein EN753_20570 [Mesorhizobium sp. M2A.F.Ca.ET.029.05.1.1]RWB47593.1 MAG: hypothetical protein EOQ46_06055 [Mesorhizobium sp.]RWB57392.1 MAG: hypothetical protein EOQ48_26015 [Mesorhizobium sp.]
MDDLQLTKNAEAYVAASRQLGDTPLLTLQIDRTSRKALSMSITALIDMLDDLDPDPDLEDTADDEPSLGWTARGPAASSNLFLDGRGSAYDDREADDSDYEPNGDEKDSSWAVGGGKGAHWCEDAEDGGDHEHNLGWREAGSLSGDLACFGDGDDVEPSLGWTNHIDQRLSMIETENDWHVMDGEEDPDDEDEREDDSYSGL